MYWFDGIVGALREPPLVCPVCHGKRFTDDSSGKKYPCGACGNYLSKNKEMLHYPPERKIKL
jgi:transcription initiation factor TFIIIB Brf1 subunit/transcription initiation factor TFIIB